MMFRQPISTGKWLLSLTVVAVAFALMGSVVALSVTAQQDAIQVETDTLFAEVYDRVSPAVVSISVEARREGAGRFGQDQTVRGGGTGFLFDKEGNIITNFHVVEGATNIEVNFVDGTLAYAEIVGLDPDSDLAVLRAELPASDLARFQPMEFGDSNGLYIGQSVLALGSPFGQRWTLTSGIVSALDRTIQGLTNFSIGGVIQTDAAINPGNSGGPLLDLNGRVIGVNTQIISGSRSSAGIGFAIPGNLTQRVAKRLIEDGSVDYSYIGISGSDVNLQLIDAFGLANNTQGVFVFGAAPDSPASLAGIADAVPNADRTAPSSGDIITAIDGTPITGMGDLVAYLATYTEPGQSVVLTVLRNGEEELALAVELTSRP